MSLFCEEPLEKELYPIPGGECNSIMNYIIVIFWGLYALCLSIVIWVNFECLL